MKSRNLSWAIPFLSAFALTSLAAQTVPLQVPSKPVAATPIDKPDEKSQATALATLKALVDDKNYKKLGFQTREEVASAVFGLPIRRYIVRPDRLLKYADKVDPASTLTDTAHWIYPVLVNNSVRCAVTIERMKDVGWKATSFGDQDFARVMFSTRKEESLAPTGLPEESFFLVDILSARRQFLGRRTGNGPPDETPGLGKMLFTWIGPPHGANQKTQPAGEVLLYLSKIAKANKSSGPGR